MEEGRDAIRHTVTDSSVLINFLRLGRLSLLTDLPLCTILIVAKVDGEIKRDRAALTAALAVGTIRRIESMVSTDATLFARLSQRVSPADASCIVAASQLGAVLAADDRVCRRLAADEIGAGRLIGTERLLLEGVRSRLITMDEGDALLRALPGLRYQPKVRSLTELTD